MPAHNGVPFPLLPEDTPGTHPQRSARARFTTCSAHSLPPGLQCCGFYFSHICPFPGIVCNATPKTSATTTMAHIISQVFLLAFHPSSFLSHLYSFLVHRGGILNNSAKLNNMKRKMTIEEGYKINGFFFLIALAISTHDNRRVELSKSRQSFYPPRLPSARWGWHTASAVSLNPAPLPVQINIELET